MLWVGGQSPPPMAPSDKVIEKLPDPAVPHDARYFSQTGFRIDNDAIWTYFQARGRVDVFGYPVSRTFTLLGCQAQMFQRQIAQVCGAPAGWR